MRNINNVFETRPIEVVHGITNEVILLGRTFSKTREYLRLIGAKRSFSEHINTGKILFSQRLQIGVKLNDYKERWQNKQNIVLVSKNENK
jgi:hypothetical protein